MEEERLPVAESLKFIVLGGLVFASEDSHVVDPLPANELPPPRAYGAAPPIVVIQEAADVVMLLLAALAAL